ncbi:hypothetical protein A0H81_12877 [Grifola frondosa]|uniref:Uncharacterized protein n=1 Tax=Grifola frondosa TaxID=5627 RepID=A0A1C7LR80_GRIFR|nr:hypothetical protein A0H81_12877 [Grifola frondosa]
MHTEPPHESPPMPVPPMPPSQDNLAASMSPRSFASFSPLAGDAAVEYDLMHELREAASSPTPINELLRDPVVLTTLLGHRRKSRRGSSTSQQRGREPERERDSHQSSKNSSRTRDPRRREKDTSDGASILTHVLAEEERQARHLKAVLRQTGERLEQELRRADQAETRARTAEALSRDAGTRIAAAEAGRHLAEIEATRAQEETRRVQMLAETTERDLRRSEKEIQRLERLRSETEQSLAEARDVARKAQQALREYQAREEGREEGRQLEVRRRYNDGRDDGYEDGRAEGFEAGYAEGLEAGKEEGIEAGRSEGYSAGRLTGFDEGKKAGWSEGYNEGMEQGRKEERARALEAFDKFIDSELDRRSVNTYYTEDERTQRWVEKQMKEPSPKPMREPLPQPPRNRSPNWLREPSPRRVREPSPQPVRELSPQPVREPSPLPKPFPLPPSPSTLQPDEIIDAHVVAPDGDLQHWKTQAGQTLGGRIRGVVLSLHEKEPAATTQVVERLMAETSDTPILAIAVPFVLEDGVPTSLPSYLSSNSPSKPSIVLSSAFTKSSPEAIAALSWAFAEGYTIDIDVQCNIRDEGGWEAFEDFLTKATGVPDPKGKIVISNILPPPDDLALPIVKLLTHPSYRSYQSHTASLSLFPNLFISYRPPSWGIATPPSEAAEPTQDSKEKKEWKRRIKMYIGPAVEAFGFQRILFGSSPSSLSAATSNAGDWFELAREAFAELGVEQDAIDAVFFENAKLVYASSYLSANLASRISSTYPNFVLPNCTMHQALETKDIFILIIESLQINADDENDEKEWGRSLAALARTCRTFHEPALDALWCSQPHLVNLVKCIPQKAWQMNWSRISKRNELSFTRPLFPTDLDRFRLYAARIKKLGSPASESCIDYPATKLDKTLLPSLCIFQSSQPLLPNLQSLCWHCADFLDNSPSIHMFLGPNLRELSLILMSRNYDHLPAIASLFAHLPQLSRGLTRLRCMGHLSARISRELSNFIEVFRGLEVIQLSMPDASEPECAAKLLLFVAGLPALKTLVITPPMDALLDSTDADTTHLLAAFSVVQGLAFPSLKMFGLQGVSLTIAAAALPLLKWAPQIGNIDIMLQIQSTSSDFQASCELIGDNCLHQSLEFITLRKTPIDSQRFIVSLTDTTFRPLLVFRHLKRFTIDFPHAAAYNDQFIKELALAWPLLSKLCLKGSTNQSSVTLEGLVHLVIHCPHLASLEIGIDASVVPKDFNRRPGDGFHNWSISELKLGNSAILDPLWVAAFLSGLFPMLTKVVATGNTETVSRWDAVSGMLGAFTMVGDRRDVGWKHGRLLDFWKVVRMDWP